MPRDDTRRGPRSIPSESREFREASDLFLFFFFLGGGRGAQTLGGLGLREREFSPVAGSGGASDPAPAMAEEISMSSDLDPNRPPPPRPDAQPEQTTRAKRPQSGGPLQQSRTAQRQSRARRAKGAAESKQKPSRQSKADPDS